MTSLKVFAPLAAALLLSAPAHLAAQSTTTEGAQSTMTQGLQSSALQQLDDDNETALWNGLSVDQLEDMDIVNADGDEIGEVDEVLGDASGNIVAVTAAFGGFMGMGDKKVIVPMDQFQLREEKLVTTLTEDQLETMPEWEEN